MRTVKPNEGRTSASYKVQPQASKWICCVCPKIENMNRRKGEPRFIFKSFATRADLLHHMQSHLPH